LEATLGQRDGLPPDSMSKVGLGVAFPGSDQHGPAMTEAIERRDDDLLPILRSEAVGPREGALACFPGKTMRLLLDARRAAQEADRALLDLLEDAAPPRALAGRMGAEARSRIGDADAGRGRRDRGAEPHHLGRGGSAGLHLAELILPAGHGLSAI